MSHAHAHMAEMLNYIALSPGGKRALGQVCIRPKPSIPNAYTLHTKPFTLYPVANAHWVRCAYVMIHSCLIPTPCTLNHTPYTQRHAN